MSRFIPSQHQTFLKEAIVNTWSTKQTQQNERSVLGLSLPGLANPLTLASISMTKSTGKLQQANRATAAFCPVGIPVISIHRDPSMSCQRSFSKRHTDWTHSIQGLNPLSPGTLS